MLDESPDKGALCLPTGVKTADTCGKHDGPAEHAGAAILEEPTSSLSPELVEFMESDEEVLEELSSDPEKPESAIVDLTVHSACHKELPELLVNPEEVPAAIEGLNGRRSRLRTLQAIERRLERELIAAVANDRPAEAARIRRAYNENFNELKALCRALGIIR
ncbi:MAG: hypothetical protein QY316_06345 [Thermodesulfobacteriota bacterium]|nr:MAG: hypothetical protein QY316_06345 [Thermodesulfobacteriota bacterium]